MISARLLMISARFTYIAENHGSTSHLGEV